MPPARGARSTAAWLRAMDTRTLARILDQPPDHELVSLYAQALRELGRFLGARRALDVVAECGGSAERLAEALVRGMAMFDDRGFYKRAQLVPADLALAGVADFADLDRLTIFADNLVPHVLRCEGVLLYDESLATRIDAGETSPQAAPSARSAPARCTPASCSPSAPGSLRACSTSVCGTAGRRPRTRRARATAAGACTTESTVMLGGVLCRGCRRRVLLPHSARPRAPTRRPSGGYCFLLPLRLPRLGVGLDEHLGARGRALVALRRRAIPWRR